MSGYLENGQWFSGWYDTQKTKGEFIRTVSTFRDWVTVDGSSGYRAEPGRYHLYVSLACPWAHRTLIFRALKRLESVITVSVVDPVMSDQGWAFNNDLPDHLHGYSYLHQLYTDSEPMFSGRVSVPVLWDKFKQRVVNNESSEIIRMLNSSFDKFGDASIDFYPAKMRNEINQLNDFIYANINNGVYRCGFASSQEAYQSAFDRLFAALDQLDARLSNSRFLFGEMPLETDWRLFVTLARFDAVYVGHFKCNRNRIEDFLNLSRYLKDLYDVPGVAATLDIDHIKRHYYISHPHINPSRIVPSGPRLKFCTSFVET